MEQVREIAEYIALDKPTVAITWAKEIFDSVKRLTDFPKSGRVVPELKRDELREIVMGNYRVIYKIKGDKILVLVVKSYRQKLAPEDV